VSAQGLPYLEPCGGTHSSEWFWSKLLHAARTAPAVIAAAAGWVELQDFVPAWLCGVRAPGQLRRGICAAGHKGLFSARWGGWPAPAFLRGLHPELARLAAGMPARVHCAGERAGTLAAEVAALLGLPAGIPVAVGALDAHVGAIGAGIGDGDLVKVLGTSSCDMAVASSDGLPIGIRGIAGVVPDSILPGRTGFEAGQSAVGDLFAATARLLGRSLGELEAEAMALPAGSSGLLALDWHAGNRSVLMDSQLSGLVLGWSLQSTPAEFYRAIVEASAYGARTIVATLERAGVPVRRIVACGGIAQKSPFVLQVLADVLDREIRVSDSPQACALGAAILGAVAAGAVPTVMAGQQRWCPPCSVQYRPNPRAVPVQGQLFELYTQLHDGFGRGGARDLQPVMKRLLRLREQARRA
jgi:L-ribulokinase